MSIFDWRAKNTAQGIVLGLALSIFWAAQHPFQGPLYKALGQDIDGLLEAMMYAEAVILPFYLLLFLAPSIRRGARAIHVEGLTPHLLVPPIIGIAGLALYALGQTQVDGTQVSIILAASPATMLIFMYAANKYRPGAAIKDAVSSRLIQSHLLLIIVIATLAWIGNGSSSSPINWLFAAILLLVPGFYYGSSTYTKSKFGQSHDMHLAAIALANIIGAAVFGVAIFSYLVLTRHSFNLIDLRSEIVWMFVMGGFIASFLGTITYNLNLRQTLIVQKHVSLATHSTPFFSVLIGAVASFIFVDILRTPNYYQIISALFVFAVLYLMSRKG